MLVRHSAVRGMFYPYSLIETNKMLDKFYQKVPESSSADLPRMLIVPHAGFIYSGLTAMYAYKSLENYTQFYQNVIIIAPSHRKAFRGLSLGEYNSYEHFSKLIESNKELQDLLKSKFDLGFYPEAHISEHSAEVQLSFVDYFLQDYKLLTIEHSVSDFHYLSKILDFLLQDKHNLIVISTDLSHFHSYRECQKIDEKCIKGILNLDLDLTNNGEACGMAGILAALESAKKSNLNIKKMHSCNSGDITGDKSSVVGYASFVISD